MFVLVDLIFIVSFFLMFYGLYIIVSPFVRKGKRPLKREELKKGVAISVASFVMFMISGAFVEPVETEDIAEVSQAEVAAKTDTSSNVKDEEKEKEEERKAREKEKKKEVQEQERQEKEKETKRQEEEKRQKELDEANPNDTKRFTPPSEPVKVPSGQSDVVVNDNIPYFSNKDITSTEAYHENGPFDYFGRVTAANAVVGVEIMPAEERGNISNITPTGWDQARYAGIGSGGWLYNRSHLIGHQMTGNDEPQNIMTGTRWFNERMLEYENFVANYVETTENHVRYRVTPVFEGDNLVASGAYMEAFSIEDNGKGVMFNIYIPNIQPGVEIDYADGSSVGPSGPAEEGEISEYNPGSKSSGNEDKDTSGSSGETSKEKPKNKPKEQPKEKPKEEPAPSGQGKIKGNISSEGEKIYHMPGGASYNRTKIDPSKGERYFHTEAEAQAAGFRRSQR